MPVTMPNFVTISKHQAALIQPVNREKSSNPGLMLLESAVARSALKARLLLSSYSLLTLALLLGCF